MPVFEKEGNLFLKDLISVCVCMWFRVFIGFEL